MEKDGGEGGRAFIYDRINKHSFVDMVMLAGGWFWVVGRISIVNSSSVFVLLCVCVYALFVCTMGKWREAREGSHA